jgi:hypothetical protein
LSAKKTSSRIRTPKRGKPAAEEEAELLKLVKAGVRRFILYGAPIAEFQKTIREVSKKGTNTSHPLSGVEFRRIVKDAVKQRKQKLAQRRGQKKKHGKGNPT